MKIYLTILLAVLHITAHAQKTGALLLRFENKVGDQPLILNEVKYQTEFSERFSVSLLQYYISNIRLHSTDGSVYSLPQERSYFLVKEQEDDSKRILLSDIPEGNYTAITFLIGVDSIRNTMPVARRTGCLDVGADGKDMYWAWNSGYIFVKMEGESPQIKLDSLRKTQKFMYHIGLFGGMKSRTINNIKQTTLPFGKKVKISKKTFSEIQIASEIGIIFNGKNKISLADKPTVMANPFSATVAENYQEMFSIHSISSLPVSTIPKSRFSQTE